MSIDAKIANAAEVDVFSELSTEEKMQADLLASIAIKIHERRMELGMTQAEFARFNNVTQTMVSKWESGDYNFSVQTLAKVFAKIGLNFTISKQEQFEAVKSTDCVYKQVDQWDLGTTKTPIWQNKTASRAVYIAALS